MSGVSNGFSGIVLGSIVQAGAVHGDVHFYADLPSVPSPPHQLAAPSTHFAGRERELEKLDALLDHDQRGLVVLTGPGGVGKTSLALQWAHTTQRRFADGELYVDLEGVGEDGPVMPGDALSSFLRALGVPPRSVPDALAEQTALYRSATAHRRLLVLLDNAYSAAQVRVLIPGSASAVIVTSRKRLVGLLPDGATLLSVESLSSQESLTLLTRTLGPDRIDREHESAIALSRLCCGLPIALCVAASRLAARPHLSVGRMVTELEDETRRLDGLAVLDGPSVQAAFDLSYRSLVPQVAALYRRLGLHPGRDFGPGPVSALTALAVDGADPAAVGALETLLAANLLQEVAENRFSFHDLLRLHARSKADMDESASGRATASLAIMEWYLAAAQGADVIVTPYRRKLPYNFATKPSSVPIFSDRVDALNWLERERVNLIASGKAALDVGEPQLAWHLSDVLWPLFLFHKHYSDRLQVDTRGVDAARSWGNGWAEAVMLKRLGRSCTRAGDFGAAERHTRAAISRYQEAADRRGVNDAREGLAILFRDSGREELAAEMFSQVLQANRDLEDVRSTGLTLINLATSLVRLHRPGQALELLAEARTIFDALSDVDPYNGMRVLSALANAHLLAGDLTNAEQAANAAAVGMQDLGSYYEQAEALFVLGSVSQGRGDIAAARNQYQRALTIFEGADTVRAAGLSRLLTTLPGDPGEGPFVGEGGPAADAGTQATAS